MRVISGRFKGAALATPKTGTRPTTDRTKEAIFSHLDSWGVLDDARVLDLFAGTGALGIEALSRGARELVAVESSRPAAALIAKSIKSEEILCYEDLGTEAVRRYEVEDFPCIVAIDSNGNNVYETEPPKYRVK